jgi:hypothetical protein
MEKFLGHRVLQKFQISLFDRHWSLLAANESRPKSRAAIDPRGTSARSDEGPGLKLDGSHNRQHDRDQEDGVPAIEAFHP